MVGIFDFFRKPDEEYSALQSKSGGTKYRRGSRRPNSAASELLAASKQQEAGDFPSSGSNVGQKVFHAQTTLPQQLTFQVPEGHKKGSPICVAGPHGPLMMPVDLTAQPGDTCSVRLGPDKTFKVFIPEDKGPGDTVTFTGNRGENLQVSVPEGKKAGETFEVSQPALMVQVPLKAGPGDQLVFCAPDGRELCADVPTGTPPGQYFAVELMQPPRPSEQPEEPDSPNISATDVFI